jgi:pantetheine-phosphate adenylyltransferase
MTPRRALFSGTFDPFTIGHANIVQRALCFMDELIIGIGLNESKQPHFTVEKRLETIRRFYADEPRITVASYSGLTIDFAAQTGARFLIRGIRSVSDFEYEKSLADVNDRLSGIETILLFTRPELASVSSTLVRELLHFGKDVRGFIPEGMEW